MIIKNAKWVELFVFLVNSTVNRIKWMEDQDPHSTMANMEDLEM